ncbi:DUF2442 domain-containing protein [Chlorobium phaeobacteroides]|uniref:DUF2442 domain-containing protein n=1 Tax=Chlorobium phaeobacteroides (strain DSM 266 / SMG 266 / 2430) TaxID=290317 RepID=A1BJF1_CHLPD|nr:DUF2442 domain-containing protein [Chlorobium phaeobacteroides]ABL66528.1 hypothetical protein Cpha266_2540 [Chlorobium phaeobacteroides DSM 266]
MNEIIQIIYKTNYIYYIMFDDGTRTDIDFSGYIVNNPDFEPLQQMNIFKKATLEDGNITWPNGLNIGPQTLYENILRTEQADEQQYSFSYTTIFTSGRNTQ